MLTFRFTGVSGEMIEKEMLVSGMVGKQVRFEFSDEWEGLRKAAVYRAGDMVCTNLDIQETDTIPAAVLSKSLRRLYVGVYGISEDGQVAIPTRFVPGPFIHIGAAADEGSGFDPEDPFWVEMEQALEETVRFTPQTLTEQQQAQARANIGVAGGGGMNAAAAALLLTILRKAVYVEEVSAIILELEAAMNAGEQEDTVQYTVSCSLEHVTAQPASATVAQGESCTVVLTAEAGYVLDTVTVTMGGIDITASAYSGGTVGIGAVTGNVVITAKAVAEAEEEPEETGGMIFVPAYLSGNQLCKWGYPSPRMAAVTTEVVADTPIPQDVDLGLGDLYLLPVPALTNLLKVTCPGLIGGPQFVNLSEGVYTTPLDVGYLEENGFEYAFDADTYDFMCINFKVSDGSAFFAEDYDTSGVVIEFAVADSSGEDDGGDSGSTEVTEVPITLSLTQTSVSNAQRTINVGEQYRTTLIPTDGYYLSSVTVTMGGTDVTEQVYSDGTISIPEVTGAVFVMAVSTAEPEAVTISEIGRGTTSFVEGTGMLVNRNENMGARATVIPVGQYLKKDTTYRFSLGSVASAYYFGVQIMVASSAGLTFSTPMEEDVSFSTVTGREVDTGWMQTDYTYTPTEHNRIFTMNFKLASGAAFEESHYAELLENVVIEEVTE